MTVETNQTEIRELTVNVDSHAERIEQLELRMAELEAILTKRFSFDVSRALDLELGISKE